MRQFAGFSSPEETNQRFKFLLNEGKYTPSKSSILAILILFATLGMLVLIGSNNLMVMYLGIELQSLALYVLASIQRDSIKSAESGIKYFVLGALSSGILLYGCSLIYGFTGETNFNEIRISLFELEKLKIKPNIAFIDGPFAPKLNIKCKTFIKGDEKIPEISAASIIAKVERDKLMKKMSFSFKKYGWDNNAGYGTKDHIKAIKKFGVTRFHRKTFQPIHKILSLKK